MRLHYCSSNMHQIINKPFSFFSPPSIKQPNHLGREDASALSFLVSSLLPFIYLIFFDSSADPVLPMNVFIPLSTPASFLATSCTPTGNTLYQSTHRA